MAQKKEKEKTPDEQAQEAKSSSVEQGIINSGAPAITTPAGAAALGKNKDQAKMFGTKAQKSNALATASAQAQAQANVAQDDQLATVEGEQTFENSVQDAASQRAQEYSEKFEEFGSLGNRISNAINQQLGASNKIGIEDIDFEAAAGSLDESFADGVTPDQQEHAYLVINGFDDMLSGKWIDAEGIEQTVPEGMTAQEWAFESIVQLSEDGVFGDDTKTGEDFTILDTIKAAFGNNDTALQAMTAQAIANSVVDVEDLDIGFLRDNGFLKISDLGTNADGEPWEESDMEKTFGAGWEELTTDKIAAVMSNEFTQKYARADKLQKAIHDPNISPAIKQQLQRELEEMGVNGALQFEELGKETIEAVQDTGIVMYNGKPQKVVDLLDDDNIKQMAVSVLSDPEGKAALNMKEENPSLYKFLQTAFADVEASGEMLEGAMNEFISVNADNKATFEEPVGTTTVAISDDLWDTLGIDQGMASSRVNLEPAEAMDEDGKPFNPPKHTGYLYAALQTLGSGNGDEAMKSINLMIKDGVLDRDFLKYMSEDEAMGFVNLLSTTGPAGRSTIMEYAGMDEKWDTLKGQDESAYFNLLLGAGTQVQSKGDAQRQLNKLKFLAASGDKEAKDQLAQWENIFDTDHNGKVDKNYLAKMKGYALEQSSLETIIGNMGNKSKGLDAARLGMSNDLGDSKGAFDLIGGKLPPNAATMSKNLTSENLGSIDTLVKMGLISRGTMKTIVKEFAKKDLDNHTESEIFGLQPKNNHEYRRYNHWKGELKKGKDRISKAKKYLREHPNGTHAEHYRHTIKREKDKNTRRKKWMNDNKKKFFSGKGGKNEIASQLSALKAQHAKGGANAIIARMEWDKIKSKADGGMWQLMMGEVGRMPWEKKAMKKGAKKMKNFNWSI